MREKIKRKVIFHIGLEKTGTTSFQSFCTRNRAVLLRHSVLYPTNNLAFSEDNHNPLVASYFTKIAENQLLMRSPHWDKGTIFGSLASEIERASTDTVLISAEHLSSHFSAEQVRQLATDFSDYDCRIAVVVRDHVSRALSAYYTAIASGRNVVLKDYVSELCHPSSIYVRYKETITQWEVVFGKENIIVIPYIEKENIINALARSLISPAIRLHGIAAYFLNKSPGASAIEALRLINKERSDQQQFGELKYRCAYLLFRIRNAIRKKPSKRPKIDYTSVRICSNT